jgi:hypothetical protein
VGLQDMGLPDEVFPEVRKDDQVDPEDPFRVGDRVSIIPSLSDQEAFALGYPTYSELGTIRYSSPETSSVKWDRFEPALMLAIPSKHLVLVAEGKQKTSRFKEGDRVQVPSSMRPEAIKEFKLPPVGTGGIVLGVDGSIVTVEWDIPWVWSRIQANNLGHERFSKKVAPPNEAEAIQVGDRVAMKLFPSIQGEVLVMRKTSAHIRFDEIKKVERKRSLTKLKSYPAGDVFNTPLTAIIKVEGVSDAGKN